MIGIYADNLDSSTKYTFDFIFNSLGYPYEYLDTVDFSRCSLIIYYGKINDYQIRIKKNIIYINRLDDSKEEGYSAGTDTYTCKDKSSSGLLRTALKTKFGDVNEGFVGVNYHAADSASFPLVHRWIFSAGWTTASNYGYASSSKLTSTDGATATLTFSGTGIILFYLGTTDHRTFTYSIDGGSAVTVDTYGAAIDLAKATTITGLTEGNHTIVITKSNDTKSIYLFGACPTRGSTGVRVNSLGLYGSTVGASSAANCLKMEIDYWQPKLTVLSYGANDYSAQTSLSTFQTNLQTLITRAKQYGDVLIMANMIQLDNQTIKIQQYVDTMKNLALTNNCAFIDLYSAMGKSFTYADNVLGLMFGHDKHPNTKGHQFINKFIVKCLGL
jgi:hypothetical protein